MVAWVAYGVEVPAGAAVVGAVGTVGTVSPGRVPALWSGWGELVPHPVATSPATTTAALRRRMDRRRIAVRC
jgi:hypothetical protein